MSAPLQFSNDLADFNLVTVLVETKSGTSAYGDVYAAAVAVIGMVERKSHIVRSTSGDAGGSSRANASTVFYGPVESADLFHTGSRVTYLGSTYEVLTVDIFQTGETLPDHVAVTLI